MKILHIHEQLEIKGGTEKHISRLRNLFQCEGFETHLLIARSESSGQFHWNESELRSCFSIEPLHTLGKKLAQLLEKTTPDAIFIHGISFPELLKQVFQQAHCPIFRYMHEPRMICPGHGKFLYRSEACCEKRFGLNCLTSAYREICAPRNPSRLVYNFRNTHFELSEAAEKYTKIIVASDYMRNEAEKSGLNHQKIIKIPPPTDPGLPSFTPVNKSESRILFIGRMSETKGPHVLIHMLAPFLKQYSSWHLDFVGDGLIKNKCIQISKEHDLSGQIHFHGWRPAELLDSYYKECSIVAFPTLYPEAFGGVGLEAFRHGRPVVGFDVGGVSEWLKNGVNGRLIKRGDYKSFSTAIHQILSDSDALNQLGLQARKFVSQNFGPNQVLRKYKEILPTTDLLISN